MCIMHSEELYESEKYQEMLDSALVFVLVMLLLVLVH